MAKRNIIVVGASAGGVTALEALVASLPADLKAAVFIVLHVPAYSRSKLPEILSRCGPLKAVHPVDGQEIEEGMIYVAPNDHHMVLMEDKILIRRGPKENRNRPAIDALFRSAAYTYRERVIGIILSGILNDGVSGLWTIKELGGKAIIQSLEEADQPQLPENVLEYVDVDHVIDGKDMGAVLAGMIQDDAKPTNRLNELDLDRIATEATIASSDSAFELGIMDMGLYTPFTCGECNGAVIRLVEGKLLRYRCHTGHAFTASALLSKISGSVEIDLWRAMRGMEEMNMLMQSISDHYVQLSQPDAAKLFTTKAQEGLERSRLLRKAVMEQRNYSEDLRLDTTSPGDGDGPGSVA